MSFYRFSPRASREFTRLRAGFGPQADVDFVQDVLRTCRLLAGFPEWGWPLKTRPRRKFPVGKFHILVYQPLRGGIEVKRIVDGRSREAAKALR